MRCGEVYIRILNLSPMSLLSSIKYQNRRSQMFELLILRVMPLVTHLLYAVVSLQQALFCKYGASEGSARST